MIKLALIFFSSGFGGLLRYWVGGLMQTWWDSAPHAAAQAGWWCAGFPVGTMLVNVSGCLAIGFLSTAFGGAFLVRQELQIAILVGLLGGYTTFSAFGRETFAMLHDGQWVHAGAYAMLTNATGLAAVWLGSFGAARWVGTGAP